MASDSESLGGGSNSANLQGMRQASHPASQPAIQPADRLAICSKPNGAQTAFGQAPASASIHQRELADFGFSKASYYAYSQNHVFP